MLLQQHCYMRASQCLAPRHVKLGSLPGASALPRSRSAPATAAPVHSNHRRTQHIACSAKATQQPPQQLPASLKKIVGSFQMVPDPMARYKQLLFYATKLQAMPAEDHTPGNKVEGCVSQVWVKPRLGDDGLIYWSADSDSALTKGLAALLVLGLSGCTAQEIIQVDPGFIEALGLKQSLTPSRNNGFLNMLALMKRKAAVLAAATDLAASPSASPAASGEPSTGGASAPSSSSTTTTTTSTSSGSASASAPAAAVAAAVATSRNPIRDGMKLKLTETFKPESLHIVDESQMHAGHAAMRAVAGKAGGGAAETHFKVELVSAEFEGLTQVKRQRWVYQVLQEEFSLGLHALSLLTKAPSEVK